MYANAMKFKKNFLKHKKVMGYWYSFLFFGKPTNILASVQWAESLILILIPGYLVRK